MARDPNQQVLQLKNEGLYTNYNRFDAPQGACSIADNLVIDQVSVAQSRRGQNFYGNQLTVGIGDVDQLLTYRNVLEVNYNGTLAYDRDNAGTWINYSGTFVPPSLNGVKTKMKSIQAQGNNYITTNKGVYVQDSLTTNPILAGVPLALSCSGTTNGTIGFLGTNANVAYRAVIGTTDANSNLKLGSPSNRGIVSNPNINLTIISATGTTITVGTNAGVLIGDTLSQVVNSFNAIVTGTSGGTTITVNGSFAWTAGSATSGHDTNATVSFVLPGGQGLGTNYFYQIYRSNQSATASSEPDDECQLVYQANLTSANLTAGTITYTDALPDSLRGAALYTNTSQDPLGIENANAPPPLCTDMCVFDGYALYANCTQKNTMQFSLVGLEPPFGLTYLNTTGTVTFGTNVVTISDTSTLHPGMSIIGADIPANTTITSITNGSTLVMSANATNNSSSESIKINDIVDIAGVNYLASGSNNVSTNEFFVDTTNVSIGQNINNTANNLIYVINLSTSNTLVYGINLSGFTGTPGQILIQERLIGGATFYATSTQGGAFSPTIPASGTSFASNNSARQNRIYQAKFLQPDAVPIISNIDVGSRDFPILRIINLTTSVYIIKQDGNFRLVDQGGGNFALSQTTNNTICILPESAVVLDNQIFMYSDQGIVAMSDTGSIVKSFFIEDELLDLSSGNFPAFVPTSFAIAYESNRKYIFYTVSNPTDTYPTQAFIYNYITNTWTRWTNARSCGIFNKRDQRLYLGNPTNGYVYQERKSLNADTNQDYADEQYAINITSSSNFTVNVNSTTNIQVGMTLVQGFLQALVTQVVSSIQIIVDTNLPWLITTAAVYTPIPVNLQYLPQACSNPGMVKEFQELTLIFKTASFDNITLVTSTNFQRGDIFNVLPISSGLGWGNFPWGGQPWGGGTNTNQELRTFIPNENMQALYIQIGLQLNQAFTNINFEGLSLMYSNISSRFRGANP